MSASLRIVVVDDHPIFRSGLRTLIDAQPDMTVVAEAADGEVAVHKVAELTPDVVVLDVAMPMVSGPTAAERMIDAHPTVGILGLSAHEDAGHVRRLLAAGARGYVVKRAAPDDIVRAIRRVAAGEVYLDPAIASAVLAGVVPGRGAGATSPELSKREAEVLKQIACGHPIKEIAARLDVAVRTVETYRARAMEKLHLESRADLIRYAVERGWLNGD